MNGENFVRNAGVLMENIGIETEQIEYKKTTGELKEAITSIVAILNKHSFENCIWCQK